MSECIICYLGGLLSYFILKIRYKDFSDTYKSETVSLKRRKEAERLKIEDKVILLVTNFNKFAAIAIVKNISTEVKPYKIKVRFLPFKSKLPARNSTIEGLNKRSKLVEIDKSIYDGIHTTMEIPDNKINDFSDLKNVSQSKGERFEYKVYQFFDKFLNIPEIGAKVTHSYDWQIGGKKHVIDTYISIDEYEIICDAFISKNEMPTKLVNFNSFKRELEKSGKSPDLVKFVLFCEEDIGPKSLEEKDGVKIFDKSAIVYYNDLEKKVGDKSIAAYHLLGELEIKLNKPIKIRYPFIKLNEGLEKLIYVFKADIKEIAPLLYVARRVRGKKNFYQRLLDKKKLSGSDGIENYLAGEEENANPEHTTFLNSIIISPSEIKENQDEQGAYLELPFGYGGTAILDGQHRAYGAYIFSVENKMSINLIFTAIVDESGKAIPLEEQQEYFVSINRTQTKVDAESIWRSYSELPGFRNRLNGIISLSIKQLEKEGVFKIKKRIPQEDDSDSSSKAGKSGLSFPGLCRETLAYVKSTRLIGIKKNNKEYSDEEVKDAVNEIKRYLKMLVALINEEVKLENSGFFLERDGGIAILLELYKLVWQNASQSKNGNYKEAMRPYFHALSSALAEDSGYVERATTSGGEARRKEVNYLLTKINAKLPLGVSQLPVSIYPQSISTKSEQLERIAAFLDNLTKTKIKLDAGEPDVVMAASGKWAAITLTLTQTNSITEKDEFYSFINHVHQLIVEGGKNIPKEFKEAQFVKDINALRRWADHDVGQSIDKKKVYEKQRDAEHAIKDFIGVESTPELLNGGQLTRLAGSILQGLEEYLESLYKGIASRKV